MFTPQCTSEVVNVYWGSASGPLLGTSPADGNGTTGPITFTIPPGPGGTFTLYAVGQASGAIATATFKVTSSLTIMPGSGAHGSQATLSGISFGANEIVIVKWNCRKSSCSSQTTLATVTTDANGNFSAMITIPKNAQVGTTYAIGALGKTSKAFALTSYQVTS